MDTVIIIAILVFVIGAAARYVYKEKKKGTVCIGCPDAQHCASAQKGGCGGNCGGCSGCKDN